MFIVIVDCLAFSTKPQSDSTHKCRITTDEDYAQFKVEDSSWLLWEKKTTDSWARSVTSLSPPPAPADCPIVWRRWTSSSSTKHWQYNLSSGLGEVDEEEEEPGLQQYPFLSVDLKRSFRVTKVSILGGENVTQPLHNIEVRVGAQNRGQTAQPITENTRCGVFYGPALVGHQWINVDCGYDRGILGR